MNNYTSICELWGSDQELAADTGASLAAVQKWRQRNKIPPGWWQEVIAAARRRGFRGITLQVLADIARANRISA